MSQHLREICHFNPLPPCGGRPDSIVDLRTRLTISIHSLRVEGDVKSCEKENTHAAISIHSLRVEGDTARLVVPAVQRISIHSLRVEGDGRHHQADRCRRTFQSTPSVWRETAKHAADPGKSKNFNPLPPCGGRLLDLTLARRHPNISIHSLRVEGDKEYQRRVQMVRDFNPLPPCGGRR